MLLVSLATIAVPSACLAADIPPAGIALPDPREQARKHWAFQPVHRPATPPVRNLSWARNPVDLFVLASMEANGLEASPAADRRTLMRRASFVLTGLPPTLEEVAAFETDSSPEAFDRVMDRLLDSPRYGERWGRHWLDIARYADTKGYVFEEERRYPYAYTYRDWVIRSFNNDKPYDRFLVEQIAGDFMATPEDPTPLAAMGFLTLGRRFLNNPHDIIDDRLDVVMRGTLGLTIGCARCHDHKYDPIPSADYYSLYGVFASSHEPAEKPLLGTNPDPALHAEFQKELARRETERDDFVRGKEEEHRRNLRKSVGDYLLAARDTAGFDSGKREELARSRQLSPLVLERWTLALEKWRKEPDPLFSAWIALSSVPTNGFVEAARPVATAIAANAGNRHDPAVATAFAGEPPPSLEEVAKRYNRIFAEPGSDGVRSFLAATATPIDLKPDELYRLFNVPDGQRKRGLQRAVEELHATHRGAPPRAMAMTDNDTPTDPVVFKRGNPSNPGAKVPRQFLEFLSGPERKPFSKGSGRLELAQAIADPANPLTARVAVNRIWLQMFGAPLVRTPSDFGLRSEPPSHPELLDWLAATFVEQGWSFKRLQRIILRSATWQQASHAVEPAHSRDPDNRFFSRQNRRRLDFEGTRDFLLHAAGRLDLAMGGHSVEIAAKDGAPRRTVYGIVERQNLPGMFRTFDFASPDTSSAQRFQTTVPQQALYFMNSPFALEQVRGFARQAPGAGSGSSDEQIARLYAIAFQRQPGPFEIELARGFVEAKPPSDPSVTPGPSWQYGTGTLDENAGRVAGFRPLPYFTGKAWQGGPTLPDPKLGWVMLDASGGHPGGRNHGPAIRRWTSPVDGELELSGTLKHPGEVGDGVRAFVVSSRNGIVGRWTARGSSAETRLEKVEVTRGDTLDFVVDCGADENTDSFQWAPGLRDAGRGTGRTWDARAEFEGPSALAVPLTRWEQLAQVLLMANEAVIFD